MKEPRKRRNKNMNKSQVYSKHRYARIAPKKVAVVLDLVRGKNATEAVRILKFDETKVAQLALKVLQTAIANARTVHNLVEDKLFVSETWVDGGPMQKRGRIVGRSNFNPILKRTSHITFGLSERKGK